jgi:hypothetical protein
MNKRLYGIKKFMDDIMMNEELNSSDDLHKFLAANDEEYSAYKDHRYK